MRLLIISLMLLCTACTSIPEPQRKPEIAWFAMGFGCPEFEEIAPHFESRNTYGVVACFAMDDMSTTDDPSFSGGLFPNPRQYE